MAGNGLLAARASALGVVMAHPTTRSENPGDRQLGPAEVQLVLEAAAAMDRVVDRQGRVAEFQGEVAREVPGPRDRRRPAQLRPGTEAPDVRQQPDVDGSAEVQS